MNRIGLRLLIHITALLLIIAGMPPQAALAKPKKEKPPKRTTALTNLNFMKIPAWRRGIDAGQYEIKAPRRSSWNKLTGSYSPSGARPVYPFPELTKYRESRNNLDFVFPPESKRGIASASAEVWTRWGMLSAGPITAVDAVVNNGRYSHILMSGDFTRPYLFKNGAWREMTGINQARTSSVAINHGNPNHMAVSTFFHNVFQTCDGGENWHKTATLVSNLGAQVRGIYDIDFSGDTLLVLGWKEPENGDPAGRSSIRLWRAQMNCAGGTPQLGDVFASTLNNNGIAAGKLKMSGPKVLVSTRSNNLDDSLHLVDLDTGGVELVLPPDPQWGLNRERWISSYDIANYGRDIAVALVSKVDNNLDTDEREDVPFGIQATFNNGESWAFTSPASTAYEGTTYRRADLNFNRNPSTSNTIFNKLQFDAQDLKLDARDSNFIAVFGYMGGLFISNNRGANFVKRTDRTVDVKVLPKNADYYPPEAILPLDVRIDSMQIVYKSNQRSFLIPSDQGLFEFNTATRTLTDLAPELYIAESRGVTVSECKRVYAGLWHVGAVWVEQTGAVHGFNGSESDGFGLAPAYNACKQNALSLVHGFLEDGSENSRSTTSSVYDSIKDAGIPWPFGYHPIFAAGRWWYTGDGKLLRSNARTGRFELLSVPEAPDADPAAPDPTVKAIGFDRWRELSPIWVLTSRGEVFRSDTQVDNGAWQRVLTAPQAFLSGMRNRIAVSGDDLVIPTDNGVITSYLSYDSWRQQFYRDGEWQTIYAATFDACGTLYVAVAPGKTGGGGVYRRVGSDDTWEKVGRGDENSWITDLTVEEGSRRLYAGTRGESLLYLDLPECVQGL